MITKVDVDIKKVDIVKDRDYILSELQKSESEKSYSFEESYNYGVDYIKNM